MKAVFDYWGDRVLKTLIATESDEECFSVLREEYFQEKKNKLKVASRIFCDKELVNAIACNNLGSIPLEKFELFFGSRDDCEIMSVLDCYNARKKGQALLNLHDACSRLKLKQSSRFLGIGDRNHFSLSQKSRIFCTSHDDANVFLGYSFITYLILILDYLLDQVVCTDIISNDDVDLNLAITSELCSRIKKMSPKGNRVSNLIGPRIDFSFNASIAMAVNHKISRALNLSKTIARFRVYLSKKQGGSFCHCAIDLANKNNFKLALQYYFIESSNSYFELSKEHTGKRHMRNWDIPSCAIRFFFPEVAKLSTDTLKNNSKKRFQISKNYPKFSDHFADIL